MKELSTMNEREAENEALRKSPRFDDDLRTANITRDQIARMQKKEVPLGFKSARQFEYFKLQLLKALRSEGLNDAEVGMKGTATTFYSENPNKPSGHFWDRDPQYPGDYDLNLTSEKMVLAMEEMGFEVSPDYGIYRTRHINLLFAALADFSDRWADILDRDVNIVGYPAGDRSARDASEFILVG